jgi:hypothetical protein
MQRVSEGRHTAEHILSEDPVISREEVTIASGADIVPGEVLGHVTAGSGTAAAKGSNTGNGTISAIAILGGAVDGTYTIRFTGATAFTVENPSGDVIGSGATGAAFADDIGFTITAGVTAFVAGDGFDVAVTLSAGKFKPLNPAATDGSEIAVAVSYAAVEAAASDARGVVSARLTAFKGAALKWPAGITAAQKVAAIAHLGRRDLIVR